MSEDSQAEDQTDTEPTGDSVAWDAAGFSAYRFRDVVVAAGLGDAFPLLRLEMNIFGNGFVNVGPVGPVALLRLADLAGLGLETEKERAQLRDSERKP